MTLRLLCPVLALGTSAVFSPLSLPHHGGRCQGGGGEKENPLLFQIQRIRALGDFVEEGPTPWAEKQLLEPGAPGKARGTRLLRGSGAEARNFANKFMGFRNLQLRMPGRQILFPTEIAPASSLQIPERIQPAQSRSAGRF
jgi:hypothetical protein